jgi:hypothetical protein
VEIRYNLTDGAFQARDGATGTVAKNITNAQSSWFVNAATGDHHLAVLPPPPSIKPQPTTALPQIMTPKLGHKAALRILGLMSFHWCRRR